MVWENLGINASQPWGSWYDFTESTHAAIVAPFLPQICRFPAIRVTTATSSATSIVANRLWAADIKAFSPSTYVLFGSAAAAGAVYLPTYIDTYLPKVLSDAQWAQDNLMDAYALGNEFETSGQRGSLSIVSITRTSNVATATTASAHGLQTGDTIITSGASDSSYNVSQVACTVIDATSFTYASTGADGSAAGTLLLKAGDATLIRLIKYMAAQAQSVFTRGPILYCVSQGYQSYWITAGIIPDTDLDGLAFNCYGENSFATWKSDIDAMFAAFGANLYITEFNQHSSWTSTRAKGFSPSQRGFDQAYSQEIYWKMKYLQSLDITKAFFFSAWNCSAPDNNSFTLWYNTNSVTGNGGALEGGWKSGFEKLLETRVSRIMLGTQQHT